MVAEVAGSEAHMVLGGRATAMAERVMVTAARAGIDDAGAARIRAAYELAMRAREAVLDSDHHPDYLHPGRTALILMIDTPVRDPALIAAGTLLESLHPELVAEPSADDEVQATLEGIPTPANSGDQLTESLLLAEPEICTVALAERLDQVRHLHLRPEDEWARLHQETEEVYLPIALRTDPTMARRYRWWCRTFGERFLGRARAARE